MAIQKLFEVTSNDGTVIYIEYDDINLKVGEIYFNVPIGEMAQVYIWNNGALIYDHLYSEGFYSETILGSYRVIETIVDGELVVTLPDIAWSYSEIKL